MHNRLYSSTLNQDGSTPVAQKVTVALLDDLDGSGATGTVEFALDGKIYEIDLSENNAGKLRDALAPYVDAARRPGGSPRRSQSPSRAAASAADRERNMAIREWANSN